MPFDLLLSWLRDLYLLVRDNDEKALFLLLLVEEAGVPLPLPGDTIIAFAGYRASAGQIGLVEAGLAVTFAVQMGSTILYLFSRKLGHGLLFKYGSLIHLDMAKLEKVERWIQRHGPVMVLVGRLTPGLRTPTSIMAGVFEVPFHQFLLYTTLAAIIWSVFWLLLGYYFGRNLLPLAAYIHYPFYAVVAVVVVAVIVAMAYRWYRRRQAARPSQAREALPVSSGDRSG